jgi:hypothetical protein
LGMRVWTWFILLRRGGQWWVLINRVLNVWVPLLASQGLLFKLVNSSPASLLLFWSECNFCLWSRTTQHINSINPFSMFFYDPNFWRQTSSTNFNSFTFKWNFTKYITADNRQKTLIHGNSEYRHHHHHSIMHL